MSTQFFGYLSGIAITLSFLPYLIGIFRGRTKPERVSWLLWSILGGIAFFTQSAKGAGDSLWLTGAQAVGDLLIFILALKYGIGGFLKRDKIALVVAFLSLVLWYLTNEPLFTLLVVVLIDGTGAVLTIIKTYELPETEPMLSWILTALGGLFGILAVGSFDFALLVFPVYTFLVNIAIVMSIILGRKKHSSVLSDTK